jgi:hypothetical protein
VFGLPFDSGHVLALRVFPQNSFAPYRSVWHRTPEGEWTIWVDGPRLDTACPRYFGPACRTVGHARIDVEWTGPRTLHVTLDMPQLDWTLSVARSPLLGALNAISARLPLASWRPPALLRARERMAAALGMGKLALDGSMPSGHSGLLMPERMHLIDGATASLDGLDLGQPIRTTDNPTIGSVALPARGVLAIGQAMWPIQDPDEFSRTRSQLEKEPA